MFKIGNSAGTKDFSTIPPDEASKSNPFRKEQEAGGQPFSYSLTAGRNTSEQSEAAGLTSNIPLYQAGFTVPAAALNRPSLAAIPGIVNFREETVQTEHKGKFALTP